jgi:hypothetical protein
MLRFCKIKKKYSNNNNSNNKDFFNKNLIKKFMLFKIIREYLI